MKYKAIREEREGEERQRRRTGEVRRDSREEKVKKKRKLKYESCVQVTELQFDPPKQFSNRGTIGKSFKKP